VGGAISDFNILQPCGPGYHCTSCASCSPPVSDKSYLCHKLSQGLNEPWSVLAGVWCQELSALNKRQAGLWRRLTPYLPPSGCVLTHSPVLLSRVCGVQDLPAGLAPISFQGGCLIRSEGKSFLSFCPSQVPGWWPSQKCRRLITLPQASQALGKQALYH
jgi:hypothetical protein